jgi:hypothetical protein
MAEHKVAISVPEHIDIFSGDAAQAVQPDNGVLALDGMQFEEEPQQPRSKLRLFAVLTGLYVCEPFHWLRCGKKGISHSLTLQSS